MSQAKKQRVWRPSRQVVRAETRRLLWQKLKETDFVGERVAVRAPNGDPIIRRPARSVLKDMLRKAFRKRCAELREESAAAVIQRDRR